MTLSDPELQSLCASAVSAAASAAFRISETSPSSLSVDRKAGMNSLASEVVSQLDRDAEAIILDELAASIEQFDLGVLAEESGDNRERFEKAYFWCIDPLDGTLPFLEGKPGYAVSIALVSREGVPVIGVVRDPRTGNHFHAIANQGAFYNDEPFRVAEPGRELQVFTDRSMPEHPRFQPCMNALGAAGIHPPAGAVMNVCDMLLHPPACYFKFPKPEPGGGSIWDYAATACITREAGGVATDLEGRALDLNRNDSSFMNHRGFIFATDASLHARVRQVVRSSD